MKLFLLLFFVAGCSTMNDKCKTANWEDYGEGDALDGTNHTYTFWANECRKYGVIPDASSYKKGYKKSLNNFCTFQNGYLLGNEGKELPKICITETNEKFTKGYIEGKRSFDSNAALEKQTQIPEGH